jgi:hypothetical protein
MEQKSKESPRVNDNDNKMKRNEIGTCRNHLRLSHIILIFRRGGSASSLALLHEVLINTALLLMVYGVLSQTKMV